MEKLALGKPQPPNIKGYELTYNNGKKRLIPKKPKVVKQQKEYQVKRKEDDFFNLKFVKNIFK